MTSHLAGKRVLVMGLGRFGGGVGVTRFLHQQGALVTVTDQLPPEKLKTSLDRLANLANIQFRLGEHREQDFATADLVVVNPAVKPQANPYLAAATAAGVPLTSEIALLIDRLPNRRRTIGITGTAGKSTVTAMVGAILRAACGEQRVHVGGNLGGSLLMSLEKIRHDDWVVLELSSFMLDALRPMRWSPHIAVLTNLSPNHLDWHGSFEAYRAAKRVIFDYQSDEDFAVMMRGDAKRFSLDESRNGARVMCVDDPDAEPLATPLLLPGKHNQINATFAQTVADLAGVDRKIATQTLAEFAGLPHRLQLVATYQDVRFFNDSKSTTPEAAMLAINSFPRGTVHIILGGYDKGANLTELAKQAARRCRGVFTLGVTGPAIAAAARQANGPAIIRESDTLDAAVRAALGEVQRGDVLVLSPGCASWDQFDNYEARGRAFASAILKYTTETNLHPR